MINLSESIRRAFFNHENIVTYYSLINTLFSKNRIDLIHRAKTISVAYECITMNQTYGFSLCKIFECIKEIFVVNDTLRLHSELDISDFDSFLVCLESLNQKYRMTDNQFISKEMEKKGIENNQTKSSVYDNSTFSQ